MVSVTAKGRFGIELFINKILSFLNFQVEQDEEETLKYGVYMELGVAGTSGCEDIYLGASKLS